MSTTEITTEQAAEQKAAIAQAAKDAKKAEKAAAAQAKKDQAAKDKADAAAKIAADRAERKAAAEAKKAAPKPLCGCGCGAQTKGGRFLPGHDARLHARVKTLRETGSLPATLTAEEAQAAQDAFAAGLHLDKGSFAPRWDASKGETAPVKPRASQEVLGKRICQLRDLLKKLEAEYEIAPAS